LLLQEVFDVNVVAPEQLSLDGCAKTLSERNKETKTSGVVFGVRCRERKSGFIELDL